MTGFLMTIFTVFETVRCIIYHSKRQFYPGIKLKAGISLVFSGFSCAALVTGFLCGLIAYCKRTKDWNGEKEAQTKAGKLHKNLGYFVLFIGFAISGMGVNNYQKHVPRGSAPTLQWVYLLGYPAFALVFEIAFQIWRRRGTRELHVRPDLFQISPEEVRKEVLFRNKNWLILDNLVLDISSSLPGSQYINFHPGGRFVLAKNLGRDISKYFYGGYQLVQRNPKDRNSVQIYNHSHAAIQICNRMVIANLEGQARVKPVVAINVHRQSVNCLINCFKL